MPTPQLTTQEVEFFRANGYLLPHRQLFSEEKLAELERIFDEHLADKGDKLSDELDTPHYRDARLLEFLLSDEVLDTVEPLTGPNIALWSSHFISKDPFTGRETPWHEDSAFWNGRFSAYDGIVTVWLAIEGPSTRENGCMRVIPGTHLQFGSSEYVPADMTTKTFHAEIAEVTRTRPSTSSCSVASSPCTTAGSSTEPGPTPARSGVPATPCATSRPR